MPPLREILADFKVSTGRTLKVNVGTRDNNIWMIYFDRGDSMTDEEIPTDRYSETSGGIQFLYYDKVQHDAILEDGTLIMPVAMPPESSETLPVPPGQKDPISLDLITDGMKMATFNNEYGRRYYQYQSVKELMERGQHGATGEPVSNVKSYTAKIEGKTRVKFEGKTYDLVVISPGKYHLEDDSGVVIKEYDDTTLENAPLDHIGGGRRKSRRVKKRHVSRRAKRRTRRSKY